MMKKTWFTLIEIIIAIWVIAILSTVAIPQVQWYLERARATEYDLAIKDSIIVLENYIKEENVISQPAQTLLQRELYYIPINPTTTWVVWSWEVHVWLRDYFHKDSTWIQSMKVLQRGGDPNWISRPIFVYATANWLRENWSYHDIPWVADIFDTTIKIPLTYWWKDWKYTVFNWTAALSWSYYPAWVDYPEWYEISYHRYNNPNVSTADSFCLPWRAYSIYDDSNYGTSIECVYFLAR